jgi:hypothetical protein
MDSSGSVSNLAAASGQDKQEEKDNRRQFNYALIKVTVFD